MSVQFYPNQGGCQITAPGFYNSFQTWATYAQTYGNPNMKILVGVPAAANAAGSGYMSTSKLAPILSTVYSQSPKQFGGLMLWNLEFAKSNTDEPYDYNCYKMVKNMISK